MKRIIIFSLLLALITQTANAQINVLLPQTLRLKSHVIFDEIRNAPYRVFPKKEFQEKALFEYIMENTLNGKVKAYDPSDPSLYNFTPQEMTNLEIKDRMGGGNDTLVVEDPDTGELIEKVISRKIDIREVKSIYFLEEWYFNAENFSFAKNVVYYSPIRHFYKDSDIDKKNAKWKKVSNINCNDFSKKEIKKSNKRLIHYTTIQYEQLTDNYEEYVNPKLRNNTTNYFLENKNAPFFTSYSKQILAKTILNKVIDGEKKAYDFHTQKEITALEAESRMGGGNDTIIIEDPNTGELVEKVFKGRIYPNEIRSYIFTEDWYLDPTTLRIVKKVRTIAPVRHFYKADDVDEENAVKRVVFDVKFNE